jgi:hypothetical protein
MAHDPIRGATIHWSFEGPMAGKRFEHVFGNDGTVSYRMLDEETDNELTPAVKSEIAHIAPDIWAVSYLGSSGYTLTVVLDFESNALVSFASNEKDLSQQKGTFEVVKPNEQRAQSGKHPPSNASA